MAKDQQVTAENVGEQDRILERNNLMKGMECISGLARQLIDKSMRGE